MLGCDEGRDQPKRCVPQVAELGLVQPQLPVTPVLSCTDLLPSHEIEVPAGSPGVVGWPDQSGQGCILVVSFL